MIGTDAFLVVGESVVDVLVDGTGTPVARPGGSPANVAAGLGRLGETVEFVTELGDDEGGALLRRHLGTSRVAVRAEPVARTARATATLDATGAAAYDFELGWTLHAPVMLPAGVRAVHIGSLGAHLPPGSAAVAGLLAELPADVAVSYDPNCRPGLMGSAAEVRAEVEALVARADLVKASSEDVAWLYPGVAPGEVAARWQESGPGLVVVTLGGDGSLAVFADGEVRRAAALVNVVDTVGAGDAFTSGLLHHLSRQGVLTPAALRSITEASVREALAFAAEAAGVACSRPGADPPWRIEVAVPVGL